MRLNEGELITPVFNGKNEEANAAAMSVWADFIKALAVIDKEFLGDKGDSTLAKSLLKGISDEATRRIGSLGSEEAPTPDEEAPAPEAPAPEAAADVPAEAPAPVDAALSADADWSARESTEPNEADLRKWRILAGIPHPNNYV